MNENDETRNTRLRGLSRRKLIKLLAASLLSGYIPVKQLATALVPGSIEEARATQPATPVQAARRREEIVKTSPRWAERGRARPAQRRMARRGLVHERHPPDA